MLSVVVVVVVLPSPTFFSGGLVLFGEEWGWCRWGNDPALAGEGRQLIAYRIVHQSRTRLH